MPSIYAHLYFGLQAQKLLPEPFLQAVREYPELFRTGLQGPDILFYYKPLKSCEINRIGYKMHDASAEEFFIHAREVYNKSGNKRQLAYLTGFLCHYTLDSACHGYIEKKISVSQLSHSEIESELDRYLILLDGKNPETVKMTEGIAPSDENAQVIAQFYKGVKPEHIKSGLKSMRFYNGLLSGRGWRRSFVTFALKISGKYDDLHGMMIPKTAPEESLDSSLRLYKLLMSALPVYQRLLGEFADFLFNGAELSDGLKFTFGPKSGWEDIPVLPYKEEKLYEI